MSVEPAEPSLSSRRGVLIALGGLALAATGAAALAGCNIWILDTREDQAEVLAGEAAPEFELPDETGRLVSLDGLLSGGKPALLVFYRGHW